MTGLYECRVYDDKSNYQHDWLNAIKNSGISSKKRKLLK